MSAEAIAKVVQDLRLGRYHSFGKAKPPVEFGGPTIDATAIYDGIRDKYIDNPSASEGIHIYEDHPCIAPPWEEAQLCYLNEHGNVVLQALSCLTQDDAYEDGWMDDLKWEADQVLDWSKVHWAVYALMFIGGRSKDEPIRTAGPVYLWRLAIANDGSPLDINWVMLKEVSDPDIFDLPLVVLLGALNFLNCRNVEIVLPARPRPEQKRLARTGVEVHTINVFPIGSRHRSAGERGQQIGGPHTPVRGHFATYGPEYNRGLLFGKYSGRFWISQHVRGELDGGHNNYDLKPERRKNEQRTVGATAERTFGDDGPGTTGAENEVAGRSPAHL